MSQTGFANPTQNIGLMRNGEKANYGDDRSLLVEFYKKTILMEAQSEKEGKPVYKDFDYIRIVTAGGKSEHHRPVRLVDDAQNLNDPERFPRQWARFQNQNLEVKDGMPLELVPFLPKAEILTFKGGSVHTLEQLAGIPDSNLHNYGMMARKWRDMAIAFLKTADDSKETTRLAAENLQLKADIEALKAQFAQFADASKTSSKGNKQ